MTKVKRLRIRNRKGRRELFGRKRSFAFIIFILVSLIAMLGSYAVFDNSRIRTDRVTVSIPSLPRDLEGYTLLHITDLNGATFGDDQAGVISAIGNTNVGAVVFTGNMVNPVTQDAGAFYTLIDALSPLNKPMYYTPGNTDPDLYDYEDGQCLPSEFHRELIARKVAVLDRPYSLSQTSAGSRLWLWPAEHLATDAQAAIATTQTNIDGLEGKKDAESTATRQHNQIMLENYEALLQARQISAVEDIVLASTHYPLTQTQIGELLNVEQAQGPAPKDADLVVSGHYLAGQWRLPPFGALVVDGPSLSRSGWFPDQDQIEGLTHGDSIQQYIGRGLGAAGNNNFRFRLFNTPEIALLRLTSQVVVR